MAKLVAENGQINEVSEYKDKSIFALFKRNAINPDSSLGMVKVYDEDGAAVYMTYPQAVSLANEIIRRCSSCTANG